MGEVRRLYERACAEFGILPRKKCLDQLDRSEVDLSHYGIGAEGGMALALVLKSNTTIKRLVLADNGLLMAGAVACAEMLNQSTHRSTGDNASSGIGGVGGRGEILRTLPGGNSALVYLDLSENRMGSFAATELCRHLARNVTLRTLKLRDNALDELFDCSAMAEPWKPIDHDENDPATTTSSSGRSGSGTLHLQPISSGTVRAQPSCHLTHLDVSSNCLGDESAKRLGALLSMDPPISTLHLGWNSIGNAGGRALAEGARGSTHLEVLDLGMNRLGNDTGLALAFVLLSQNRSVTELDVSNNRLTHCSFLMLAEVVRVNPALRVLKLGSNPVGDGTEIPLPPELSAVKKIQDAKEAAAAAKAKADAELAELQKKGSKSGSSSSGSRPKTSGGGRRSSSNRPSSRPGSRGGGSSTSGSSGRPSTSSGGDGSNSEEGGPPPMSALVQHKLLLQAQAMDRSRQVEAGGVNLMRKAVQVLVV
jgi:hypothetical protein